MKTETPNLTQICTSLQEQLIKGDLRAMQDFIDEYKLACLKKQLNKNT
jgi:hypothetical protein